MLGNAASGFGWDEEKKCVTCEFDVWHGWVKSHPGAAGLRNKPFPHFDKLALIFCKDRATSLTAETPGEAVDNIETENANAETGLEDMNLDADVGENEAFAPFSDPSVGTQRDFFFFATLIVMLLAIEIRKRDLQILVWRQLQEH